MKRLWEVKHPYYCTEGNYFRARTSSAETVFEFKSWQDFASEMSDADKDYNFLFRWDWDETDSETGEPTYTGDDYYRNGILRLFYMRQRKGYHTCCLVDVCRADEPAVVEFIRSHWEYMRTMWEPFANDNQPAETEAVA